MKTKIPDAVLAAEVSRRGLVKNDSDRRHGNGQQRINITFSRIAHAVDSAIPTKSDERLSERLYS